MMKTVTFTGEKPARLNISDLKAAVAAVAPGVEVQFIDGIAWSEYPRPYRANRPEHIAPEDVPVDFDQPWQEPDRLIFRNVPDGITKKLIGNFIRDHAPVKTDDEERAERAQQNRLAEANSLAALLRDASDEELQLLKQRIESV